MPMTEASSAVPSRRLWLYLPFLLLGLAAALWSGFWFYAKDRTQRELEMLRAREAERGRVWTCNEPGIGGFPFRFEARCASIELAARRSGGELRIASQALVVVAQIWNPQHIIIHATGPASVTQSDGGRAELDWAGFETSVELAGLAVERLSSVLRAVRFEADGSGAQPPAKVESLAVHLRRNPTRAAQEGVADLAVQAKGLTLAVLDALAGNTIPADFDLDASITRAPVFARGFSPENIDNWRDSGGRLDIARLIIGKGQARFEASGELALDEQRRLTGQLSSAAGGIDRIAGIPVGGLGNLGGLLSGRAAPQPGGAGPALKPLPTLEFAQGRVQAGPFRVPGLRLPPLY